MKTARAAPWILDPTADDACACRGLRRAPGARVHGGTAVQNEGVCDPGRPREIKRPRTHASEGRRRRRRRAAARDRGSPALALDGVPGHHLDHGQVQNDAGACARDRGVYGSNCASPAAGTGKGRSSRSGELAGTLLCTKRREIGRGILLTVQGSSGGARRCRRCDGDEAWQRRRVGRRSGVVEARYPRALGTGTCSKLSLMSPW
jgi:hypothetical protein